LTVCLVILSRGKGAFRNAKKTNFHYLPVLPDQRKWGLLMTDCVYTMIEPDTPYPPQRHPDAYQFNRKQLPNLSTLLQ